MEKKSEDVCKTIDEVEAKFVEMTGVIAEEWSASEDISTKKWRPKFDKLREKTNCSRPQRIEKQYEKAWW